MAKNADPRIDAYIERAADFARPVLRHIRKLVHQASPDAEETLKWGHPSFVLNGKILCGFAAFKEHAAFGFWHAEMEKLLKGDGAYDRSAMGNLGRITGLDDLPADRTFLGYIRKAVELNESGAPARPRKARKPAAPPSVPPDLAAALEKNRKAAAAWEKFSPSHRKEYIEWITGAKRDETRARRLATTLEWLAEGKTQNWRYEKC